MIAESSGGQEITFTSATGQVIYWHVRDDDGNGAAEIFSTVENLYDGRWHHYVGIRDGDAGLGITAGLNTSNDGVLIAELTGDEPSRAVEPHESEVERALAEGPKA